MRWIIGIVGLLTLAGCGESPTDAAYREAGEAEARMHTAIKAGDKARTCSEANAKTDALLRAGSNDYSRSAAMARLSCSSQ